MKKMKYLLTAVVLGLAVMTAAGTASTVYADYVDEPLPDDVDVKKEIVCTGKKGETIKVYVTGDVSPNPNFFENTEEYDFHLYDIDQYSYAGLGVVKLNLTSEDIQYGKDPGKTLEKYITWTEDIPPGRYQLGIMTNYSGYDCLIAQSADIIVTDEAGRVVDRTTNIHNFVTRMYTKVLNREAEEQGLNYWVRELKNKDKDAAEVAENFINSDEFMQRDLDDSDYLEVLYQTFFDRASDAEGKAYWMKTLAEGSSRQFVMANFVNSNEFSQICDFYKIERGTADPQKKVHSKVGAQKFALRMYTKALSRAGEEEGVNYWTNLLCTDQSDAESVAKFFIGSEEFRSKNLDNGAYLEVLYQTFFDRASDAEGKAYWLAAMENGMTREQVLENFAYSREFKSIMGRYGF